jgi:hypothetical protein
MTLISEQADPSSLTISSHRSAPEPLSAPTLEEAAMLSALSAPSMVVLEAAPSDVDDMADNGSSSLSELGDASDDQSEATPRPTTALDMDDEDSEAETERLEDTPRKLARTATDTSLADAVYTRTPSKLMHSKTAEEDESAPPTPSVITDVDEPLEADNSLHSLSLIAASEAASLEYAGKKRKRTSAEGSPVHEPEEEEPARKRSGTARLSATNGSLAGVADSSEQVDLDEELEVAEDRLSQLAPVAKLTKPRKGGRRGKRKADDSSYAFNEQLAGADAPDAEGEDDNDDEQSAAQDEEVAKKKNAIDELAKIERKFKLFREK